MTAGDRWLLPAGIEETLPPEAGRLEVHRRALLDLFSSWGYELVIPPLIEYLESLLTGIGQDLDLQTFKLIDQLTGRLMGVRADMTPQVARIDAHRLHREGPVRLCYLGTVLHTRPDGLSGSRSPIQVGAELYGHAGVESDCEVLCLMLEALAAAGVGPVHVDVGHAGIFRALAAQAGIDAEQEATLFDALQRKARAEIDALLGDYQVERATRRLIAALPELNGDRQVLCEARALLAGASQAAFTALECLERLAALMQRHDPGAPLYFDLAELRGYRYEQGVVFAAFVPGHGQEVARGGRYDQIGKVFGRARPATGFSADLKTLVRLGTGTPGLGDKRGILAPWSDDGDLRALVRRLRAGGERVVQELPGQSVSAGALGCDRVLRRKGGRWQVQVAGAPRP
jgi:ATP phosphoribosyltransferase regulatory subunit